MEADRLQAEILGPWSPAHGKEELIATDGRAIAEGHAQDSVRAAYALGTYAEAHVHAELGQGSAELLAGEGLLALEHSVLGLDQRDRRAQCGVGLGHLHAHDSAAQDDQSVGDRLGRRRLTASPGVGLRQTGDRWHRRAAANGDHDGLARRVQVLPDADSTVTVQPAMAPDEVNAAALQPWHLL